MLSFLKPCETLISFHSMFSISLSCTDCRCVCLCFVPCALCGGRFPEYDLRSDATWTQIKNVLLVAGTSEDPVVVSGRPILEVPIGMFDLNLTKKQ